MKNPNIYSLIVKKLQSKLTSQEKMNFDSWLESEANKRLFIDLEKIWKETENITHEELAEIDTERALKITKEKINGKTPTIDMTKKKRMSLLIAACLAMVALILGGLVMNIYNTDHYTTIIASQNKEFTLPDNSKVHLSKDSRIRYPNAFVNNRKIILEGKAMFDVTHNPEAPFNIETSDMNVTVLGTKFIVNDKKGQLQYVKVINGKVRVDDLIEAKSKPHILTKGLAVSRDKKGVLKKTEVSDNSMFWATNTLNYKDASLTDIFNELEQYFEVNITMGNDFHDCSFTGKFSNKDLSSILDNLQIIYDLSIEKIGNKINIAGGTC